VLDLARTILSVVGSGSEVTITERPIDDPGGPLPGYVPGEVDARVGAPDSSDRRPTANDRLGQGGIIARLTGPAPLRERERGGRSLDSQPRPEGRDMSGRAPPPRAKYVMTSSFGPDAQGPDDTDRA
jgi:hypothetical protein